MADDDGDDELILEETHHPEITESFTGEKGERFAVFVQWEAGDPHQYEETVVSSDSEMALIQAREVIERRWDPVDVWVVPHSEIAQPDPEKMGLAPATDRDYRTTAYYARNMEMPDVAERSPF